MRANSSKPSIFHAASGSSGCGPLRARQQVHQSKGSRNETSVAGIAVLLVACVGASRSQRSNVEITYIANEGVLISADGKQVLIDGLHREYGPEYAFLPAAEREKIETAKAPFDQIDLVLVSHRHKSDKPSHRHRVHDDA